jgi:hypothetical protein
MNPLILLAFLAMSGGASAAVAKMEAANDRINQAELARYEAREGSGHRLLMSDVYHYPAPAKESSTLKTDRLARP